MNTEHRTSLLLPSKCFLENLEDSFGIHVLMILWCPFLCHWGGDGCDVTLQPFHSLQGNKQCADRLYILSFHSNLQLHKNTLLLKQRKEIGTTLFPALKFLV